MSKYVNEMITGYNIPDDPDKFIEWIRNKVEEIRDLPGSSNLTIEVDYESSYDSYSGALSFQYYRDETPKEIEARREAEKRSLAFKRQQYERLKRELGE